MTLSIVTLYIDCNYVECGYAVPQWNTTFLIIEGASKKVLQFFMPLEPIYNKNFSFNEQNAYYEHCHKV
jgi:hypothetical protein